jgi:hypothetical protein
MSKLFVALKGGCLEKGFYWEGDIHIYEYKESISTKKILNEFEKRYRGEELPEHIIKDAVRIWIEEKFGHHLSWRIISE